MTIPQFILDYTDDQLTARLLAIAKHSDNPAYRLRAQTHYLGMRGSTPDECRPLALALLAEIEAQS